MDQEVKRKVLLIDDQTELLISLAEVLETRGLSVVIADSVETGFAKIQQHQQDLSFVLCDYKISETETGFDLRKKMLPELKQIPFAILSGFLTKELALEGIEHSICAFLEKPMQADSLYDLVIAKSEDRFEEVKEELEMVLEFRGDAMTMLDEIESNILSLESNPFDAPTVDNAMRLLHTIKGTSGCLGLMEVQQFSHAYEDFFGPVKRGERPATKSVVDQALKAFDTLKTMIQHMGDFGYQPESLTELSKVFELDEAKLSEETEALASIAPQTNTNHAGTTDAPTNKEADAPIPAEKVDEISVATQLLDEFMEQSGELTVLRSMVVKHVRSLEQTYGQTTTLERLVEALDEMHSVSSNMQNKIVDIRKIPLRNIMRTLPRVVRDASTATKKQVNFSVKGDSLRVDTSIAQVLTNSLVHMVRNSVDHGLEATAEDRKAGGKDPAGAVTINCFEKGEDIIVEIQDDGRGINVDVVKEKCLEKELRTQEELDEMTDNEIRAMIFEAGFSTAAQVTSVSGRGVGMDMVRSSVADVGGQILIDSVMGEGTKFTLVLPIPKSVLIIRALFVKCSGQTLALNQDEIHKVIYIEPEKRPTTLRNLNGQFFLPFEGKLIPVLKLSGLLHLDPEIDDLNIASSDGICRLVVMRAGKGFFCIAVDRVMDNEEIVVKTLADCLKEIGIYAGATFLGDGQTALVIESEGLARHAGVKTEANKSKTASTHPSGDHEGHEPPDTNSTELLVVRAVSGTEVAIQLKDVHRLEKIDARKIEFVGRQPVIRYDNRPMPIIELIEKQPIQPAQLPTESQLNIVVISCDNQLLGCFVDDIVDVFAVDTQMDSRVSGKNLLGSYHIDGRTIPLVQIFRSQSSALSESEPTDSDSATQLPEVGKKAS